MPQGSLLGPFSFLILIDDLISQCIVHKFVDDTTFSEILPRGALTSRMQTFLQQLQDWANSAKMKLNFSKTKEMILGPLARSSPQSLSDSSSSQYTIERVQKFKLLGVTVSADLNWQTHIDAVISKPGSRLHFLRILKRSGLPSEHLRHFYISAIRPALEYCSVVWHHGLSKAQCESLEAIQRRALRIIHPSTVGMPYIFALCYSELSSLYNRRELLNQKIFRTVLQSSSCIHLLLPPPRDPNLTARLRIASAYPRPALRTKRYTSFIHHGLSKYQN